MNLNEIGTLIAKHSSNFFPSVAIAQFILESGWRPGKKLSRLATDYHNLFGIKAGTSWTGSLAVMDTQEDDGTGRLYTIKGRFRAYDSYEDSIKDHDKLVAASEWLKDHYKGVFNAKTPEEQCHALQGTYATDTHYAGKLIDIIKQYDLKQFDQGGDTSMGSLDLMIKWMEERRGKVTYSMGSRLGPYSYDCSSAVYHALWAGGFKTRIGYAGNTETLFAEKGHLFTEVSRASRKRGDIFVAGQQGASLGSGGHTGIYLGDGKIIHCNYSGNGITITPDTSNYTYYPCRWFRIKGASTTAQVPTYKAPAKPFKALAVGSTATIREGASKWQTGESGIANYVGKSYKIIQVKDVKQSYSKRAYLLEGVMSWTLEQDIVEARQGDQKVTQRKTMDKVVDLVVSGKFGNGQTRIDNLRTEGYNPDEVQKAVNVYYAAKDVIAGKLGVGQARIDALKAKGLDPQAVQAKVNEMLR